MGRPLFSKAFQTAPAVREPEPPLPYEKWSYLNAFDPDSDEFFDDEHAVYEDFIDPGHLAIEEEEEEEERDMLVVRMDNASPISTQISDRDTPLHTGTEDLTRRLINDFRDLRQMEDSEFDPAVRVRLAARTFPAELRWESLPSDVTESGRTSHRRPSSASVNRGFISYHDYAQRMERVPVPTPSAPIPVPVMRSRRSASIDERALPSPSTPPARQTPVAHLSMSPPPSSTPRIYSWARNPSYSASPPTGSPFTNIHARTSYTHLSPALIRIRDVAV
ncbi:hypothetical protein PAXINDRAFT_178498 [Paxillus involutus ATCC 200175]|jgi:hypothetical protein|nr:hypothetical protein PAXINDRAFT_178498 [Paxillus involutus ATCC 200175]